MELDVTWERLLRIWWSWFWRTLVATVAGSVMAAMAGVWIGALAGFLALPLWVATGGGAAAGVVMGIGLSFIPLWQILGRDYGDFRLVLIRRR